MIIPVAVWLLMLAVIVLGWRIETYVLSKTNEKLARENWELHDRLEGSA